MMVKERKAQAQATAKVHTIEPAAHGEIATSVIKSVGFIPCPADEPPPPTQDLVSIEVLNGPKLPERPLNLIYGLRTTVQELSQFNQLARRKDLQIVTYQVGCKVNRDAANSLSLSDLPHVNYMHFERLSTDTRDLVRHYWETFMKRDGMSRKAIEQVSWRYMNFVATHPSYVDDLKRTPEFKHIEVMVYPVTWSNGQTDRCSIFSRKVIESISINRYTNLQVMLPETLDP